LLGCPWAGILLHPLSSQLPSAVEASCGRTLQVEEGRLGQHRDQVVLGVRVGGLDGV
jgi:hypothetical protein